MWSCSTEFPALVSADFGVIDERMDLDLLAGLADARPDWQLVLLGPIVKIDQSLLPKAANIHYIGMQPYADLPSFLAGWDVALLPFATNEATRFLSPTKTPEYLAAARPVVSTPIPDVIHGYGGLKAVQFGACVDEFVAACESALALDFQEELPAVDEALARISWNETWEQMEELIASVRRARSQRSTWFK